MNRSIICLWLVAAIAVLADQAGAAEGLPYGHPDFVPSPEKPIYFRPGNGWYPGATPPLEWWEGTPVQRDGLIRSKWDASKQDKARLWDFADAKSKNILWKAPVPGWSLSHPIVVGRKVFAVGEPDFVTCWDLDTGKQLWQRRVMPLVLDGLPEAKAAAGQKVLDLARALFYVSSSWPQNGESPNSLFTWGLGRDGQPAGKDHEKFFAGKREVAGKLARMVAAHRPEVEAFGDADLLKAADDDLAILRKIEGARDLAALLALLNDRKQRSLNLVGLCSRKLGVDIGGCWWGYVGSADSTLAGDGRRIYGVFDQGQVFCYDLDGNLVWGHREKAVGRRRHDNRGSFHRSPLLCGNLLLVRSILHEGNVRPLRALDTSTGKLCWEAPLTGSNYTLPRLMRLTPPAGAALDVLIGDAPVDKARNLGQQILRLSDGKVIGHFPRHDCGRGALLGICGEYVTWSSTSDGGGGPSCCYRVRLTGPDAAAAEKVFVLGEDDKKARIFYNQADFPTILDRAWLYGNRLFDATTGKQVAAMQTERLGCAVMAGRYLIALADAGVGNEPLRTRCRDDRKAISRFVVVDLSDPARPRVVSNRNLLGYKDPPADIIVKNYLSEFDPYDFAKCYAGAPSYFALMAGPVPHGSRLLIQSTAHLYCIGEK
jgi:hypothetical protein